MIAEIYSNCPIYGYRRITAMLTRRGMMVNRKKVLRLMRDMNIRAIYPGPNTSKKAKGAIIHPYLLSNLIINRPNQVWQVDITYLRTKAGFVYLTALIDVYSRMVVGFRLSNDLQLDSCLLALDDTISKYGSPEIINSDQGSQFTSDGWIRALKNNNICISMTGKGRCNDNANIERLWRSFKYEGSYLYKWQTLLELKLNIPRWIDWYNFYRPHQALRYQTPGEKYCEFMDKPKDLPTISQHQQQDLGLYFVVA
jgi:putative transposase